MIRDRWKEAGQEPRIEELLADPIAELVMSRDGLTSADVWGVVNEARDRWPRLHEDRWAHGGADLAGDAPANRLAEHVRREVRGERRVLP